MAEKIFSEHPNWNNNLTGAKKLIIGTMPPYDVCINKKDSFDFFYSSTSNYFWHILNFINKDNKTTNIDKKDYNLTDTKERIQLLRDNKIGIIDIIEKCIHNQNAKGNPLASDEDLLSIKPINLIKILKENKSINAIFCTSEFTKTLLNIFYAKSISYDKEKKKGKIVFREIDKVYDLYILYSPTKKVYYLFKNRRDKYLENYRNLLNKN